MPIYQVYWGVDSSIRLKEFDDKRIIAAKKLEAAAAKSRREDRDRKAMSLCKDQRHIFLQRS